MLNVTSLKKLKSYKKS